MPKNKSKQIVSATHDQVDSQVVNERLTPNPLSEFSLDKDELRLALVTAQFALRATRQQTPSSTNKPTGLLVLVNGMEQAGKGSAVKQLRQWVDPRLLKVEATIGYPPQDYQPIWQAHTQAMPRHGDVMVYFGNWYADLLYNIMRMISESEDKKSESSANLSALPITEWQNYLQQQLDQLDAFERDLAVNQTKVLKCWFHIDAETLKERLNDDDVDPQFLYQIDWNDTEIVEQFNKVATALLREQGDWIIIDGSDKEQATTSFCHEVLQAMQRALASSRESDSEPLADEPAESTSHTNTFMAADIPKPLTKMKDPDLDKSDYQKQLADKQAKFAKLIRARDGRHVVFAFEGMDAAGKGGAIKRMVAPLDPREYQIYNIGAPMLYELQHPYLWRFWTRLPNEQTDRISRIAIFDRTWYGRVLVERIEAFAEGHEWQRAYDEINRFEADLADAGTLVIKYWLAIDKEEQLERFEARADTPHKQFKLTDDDWRNRDNWSNYVQAAADMLARTDTEAAPWCIIATNDKRSARLQVLDHAIKQLEAMIKA
ncbi:ATPase [Psychrobacter sp. M13]|uniref:ATPase n=1 Tax=Psychrobacter sp. M13 TaxID=3067275 RepID=UPI00273AFDA2|nr:ATPase [Psychrobacter sp. M13]WLP95278.1 ATPase [Psychrobacter sp. M13]